MNSTRIGQSPANNLPFGLWNVYFYNPPHSHISNVNNVFSKSAMELDRITDGAFAQFTANSHAVFLKAFPPLNKPDTDINMQLFAAMAREYRDSGKEQEFLNKYNSKIPYERFNNETLIAETKRLVAAIKKKFGF